MYTAKDCHSWRDGHPRSRTHRPRTQISWITMYPKHIQYTPSWQTPGMVFYDSPGIIIPHPPGTRVYCPPWRLEYVISQSFHPGIIHTCSRADCGLSLGRVLPAVEWWSSPSPRLFRLLMSTPFYLAYASVDAERGLRRVLAQFRSYGVKLVLQAT